MMISFHSRGKGHWTALSPAFVVQLVPIASLPNGGAQYELTLYRRNRRKAEPVEKPRVVGLMNARVEAERMLRAAETPQDTQPEAGITRREEYIAAGPDDPALERRVRTFEKRWKVRELRRLVSTGCGQADGQPLLIVRVLYTEITDELMDEAERAEHAPTEAAR